jgi:hypothetical protein
VKFSSGIIDEYFKLQEVQKFTTTPEIEEQKFSGSPEKSRGETGVTTPVNGKNESQGDRNLTPQFVKEIDFSNLVPPILRKNKPKPVSLEKLRQEILIKSMKRVTELNKPLQKPLKFGRNNTVSDLLNIASADYFDQEETEQMRRYTSDTFEFKNS